MDESISIEKNSSRPEVLGELCFLLITLDNKYKAFYIEWLLQINHIFKIIWTRQDSKFLTNVHGVLSETIYIFCKN